MTAEETITKQAVAAQLWHLLNGYLMLTQRTDWNPPYAVVNAVDEQMPFGEWRHAMDNVRQFTSQDITRINRLFALAIRHGIVSEQYEQQSFAEIRELLTKEIN